MSRAKGVHRVASERALDFPPDWWEPPRRVTEAEYLLLEEASATQHEFDSGWMYPRFYPPGSHWAMAGGTAAHARICRELGRLVANHLLDSPCESYAADLLVAIEPGRDYYPDLVVVCGDQPAGAEQRLYDATLVAEVLSRSTARADRGRKFRAYQELESLEEYVLVDSRRRHVEVFRRDADWERVAAATGSEVTLASIGLTLDLDALYDRARIARASGA